MSAQPGPPPWPGPVFGAGLAGLSRGNCCRRSPSFGVVAFRCRLGPRRPGSRRMGARRGPPPEL